MTGRIAQPTLRLAQVEKIILKTHTVTIPVEAPIITIPRAQQFLEMSHRGATLVVQKLVDLNILYPIETNSHTRQFVARDILNVIVNEHT